MHGIRWQEDFKRENIVYRHTLPISKLKHPHSSHKLDVNDVIRASLVHKYLEH